MSETIVKGRKAVAQHFQVTERQVGNWILQGMPTLSGRQFDLVAIQIWRDRRQGILPQAPGPGPGSNPRQGTLTEERGKDFQDERLKKARADLVEMDVRQRRGELVQREEVTQMFVARILAVKQGLLTLSRKLPPQLIHCQSEREMEAVISRAVRELLEGFARPLPEKLGTRGQTPAGVQPALEDSELTQGDG